MIIKEMLKEKGAFLFKFSSEGDVYCLSHNGGYDQIVNMRTGECSYWKRGDIVYNTNVIICKAIEE